MLFANRPNNLVPINVKIRSVLLNRVSSTKFLGLIIDHRLTFSEHTLSIPKKLSQAFGMIYKHSAVLPKRTLTCLYYSLFYPHLTFGITVWGFTTAKYLRFFFLVQDKVVSLWGIEMCHGNKSTEVCPYYHFIAWLNILHVLNSIKVL